MTVKSPINIMSGGAAGEGMGVANHGFMYRNAATNPFGTGKVPETMGPEFDTPSLRELWLTPPYLHDGRAAALRDVLTSFNAQGRHGDTAGLSEAELIALEAFLLSLPLTQDELEDLFGE